MKDNCLLGNDFLSAMGFGETFDSFFGIPSQEKEEESFCSRVMSEGSGVPKFLWEFFVKETQDLNKGQKKQFASFLIEFQDLFSEEITAGIVVLRPNPEGFVYTSWKEREGGGMDGRKQ